jgi:tetratricopeptide (TPR) repeat protein
MPIGISRPAWLWWVDSSRFQRFDTTTGVRKSGTVAANGSARMTRWRTLVLGALLLVASGGGCAALMANGAFDQAVAAFEKGDYRNAIARLGDTLSRGPDSARSRILLGWSYYRVGEFERARTEFERALRLSPNEPNAYYAHEGLGWLAYKAGDYDRALASFGEALRLSPGYHNALDGLGWTFLAKGEVVKAEANFKLASERLPGDLDAGRGLGFVAYHRGDWRQAIERFREVLRQNDSDTLTRSALGWAHHFSGDDRAATQVFEDVARREPTWADPVLGLGWIAERQGRADDAKARFRTAIDKSAAYVATGDPKERLRKLLAGRPAWVDLWRDLGWGLYQQRQFALAEREFRNVTQRYPDDPDGWRGFGYALYMLKRYRESIAPLERSLASGPSLPPVRERVEIPGVAGYHEISSDASSTLAWSYYYSGDVGTALKLFRDVTQRHPEWPDPWSGLGWTLSKSGDREEAERAFRRSLVAQPGYPDAEVGLRTLGKRAR